MSELQIVRKKIQGDFFLEKSYKKAIKKAIKQAIKQDIRKL